MYGKQLTSTVLAALLVLSIVATPILATGLASAQTTTSEPTEDEYEPTSLVFLNGDDYDDIKNASDETITAIDPTSGETVWQTNTTTHSANESVQALDYGPAEKTLYALTVDWDNSTIAIYSINATSGEIQSSDSRTHDWTSNPQSLGNTITYSDGKVHYTTRVASHTYTPNSGEFTTTVEFSEDLLAYAYDATSTETALTYYTEALDTLTRTGVAESETEWTAPTPDDTSQQITSIDHTQDYTTTYRLDGEFTVYNSTTGDEVASYDRDTQSYWTLQVAENELWTHTTGNITQLNHTGLGNTSTVYDYGPGYNIDSSHAVKDDQGRIHIFTVYREVTTMGTTWSHKYIVIDPDAKERVVYERIGDDYASYDGVGPNTEIATNINTTDETIINTPPDAPSTVDIALQALASYFPTEDTVTTVMMGFWALVTVIIALKLWRYIWAIIRFFIPFL